MLLGMWFSDKSHCLKIDFFSENNGDAKPLVIVSDHLISYNIRRFQLFVLALLKNATLHKLDQPSAVTRIKEDISIDYTLIVRRK